MTTKRPFPDIPKALLDELEKRFPDRMPDGSDLPDIYRKQGQVSVIRFLRQQFDQQNTTVLAKT